MAGGRSTARPSPCLLATLADTATDTVLGTGCPPVGAAPLSLSVGKPALRQ